MKWYLSGEGLFLEGTKIKAGYVCRDMKTLERVRVLDIGKYSIKLERAGGVTDEMSVQDFCESFNFYSQGFTTHVVNLNGDVVRVPEIL